MSPGPEKINQTKSSRSLDNKDNKMQEQHPDKEINNDKQSTEDHSVNKLEAQKIDDTKKIETAVLVDEKLNPSTQTAPINGSATNIPANKKVSGSIETDKQTTDSESALNPNDSKTDTSSLSNREISSSLSAANNHTSSSGANSYNGSRKSENSLTDSRNYFNEHRRSNTQNLSKTNLYIRGLPTNTTDEDLYTMCARFGEILSTKAILDKANGCCKGYGFVQYAMAQSAEAAVVELTKGGIQAQMARIPSNHLTPSQRYPYHKSSNNHSHYQHHYQHHGASHHNSMNQSHNHNPHAHNPVQNVSDPTNLYLANLPLNMSEMELNTLLSSFGPVVSTRILRDERQNSRGVGFARMESRDKCQEIIEKLNGKSHKGSRDLLLVKFADDGNRKRHNYNHHHNSSTNSTNANNNSNSSNNNNSHHHAGNNNRLTTSDDDNRWRDGGENVEQNVNPSIYEHQRNATQGDQMSDVSMMGHMGYPRMQPTFPPTMATNAAYPTALGPPTTTAQWLHPGSGQAWNVMPQHMMQPNNLGPSNQGSIHPNPYPYISQLTSQLQNMHMGYPLSAIPPQWLPVCHHPMSPPHQAQSQQMRLSTPIQASAVVPQQIPQPMTEATHAFIGNQETARAPASKQTNIGDSNKQIPAPL